MQYSRSPPSIELVVSARDAMSRGERIVIRMGNVHLDD
jgi:hypothetical protein